MVLTFNINNFGPFNAETWGTVGEWVMILITAITAYYLYRTLRAQNQVLRIEQKRYAIENLPKFKIDLIEVDVKEIDNKSAEIYKTFNISGTFYWGTDKRAYNTKLIYAGVKKNNYKAEFKTFPAGMSMPFEFEFILENKIQMYSDGIYKNFEFKIEYDDTIGNQIEQYFSIYIGKFGQHSVNYKGDPIIKNFNI